MTLTLSSLALALALFSLFVSPPLCAHQADPIYAEFVRQPDYDVIYDFGAVDPALRKMVRDWLHAAFEDRFDGSVANFGEPFWHSMMLENLPLVQHQFTGDFEHFQLLLLDAPDDLLMNEMSSLIVLYRKSDQRTCASWLGSMYRREAQLLSVQQIFDGVWRFESLDFAKHAERIDGSCTPLGEVTTDWLPPPNWSTFTPMHLMHSR